MSDDSIRAYDIPERVRRYDADMDIMHPLRWKMIEVALELLPFDREAPLQVLDLGIGTGVFAGEILNHFPQAHVLGVDGSAAILEVAAARLAACRDRIRLEERDFRQIDDLLPAGTLDLVVSSYALHHLDAAEKLQVVRRCVTALKESGWFINADIVVAHSAALESRFQELRVAGIVSRAAGDERFADTQVTRRYLDEMEAKEQDQPQTLAQDLAIFNEAGIGAEVFWREYREVVAGGPKD